MSSEVVTYSHRVSSSVLEEEIIARRQDNSIIYNRGQFLEINMFLLLLSLSFCFASLLVCLCLYLYFEFAFYYFLKHSIYLV